MTMIVNLKQIMSTLAMGQQKTRVTPITKSWMPQSIWVLWCPTDIQMKKPTPVYGWPSKMQDLYVFLNPWFILIYFRLILKEVVLTYIN